MCPMGFGSAKAQGPLAALQCTRSEAPQLDQTLNDLKVLATSRDGIELRGKFTVMPDFAGAKRCSMML